MLERNHGHIVSIASSAGLFGVTGLADYCASKFAAVGFDECIRNEVHVSNCCVQNLACMLNVYEVLEHYTHIFLGSWKRRS